MGVARMKRTGRVIVVGSYVAGLTIRAARLPTPGETVIGHEFDSGPGGKGSNQAVQARRLGCETELVARIGRDALGDAARELWSDEGIGTRFIKIDPEAPTGVAFILLDELGSNSIVVYPGANASLTASDVDNIAGALTPDDVVVSQQEVPVEAVARAMELGRQAGAMTILNPAPARQLSPEVLGNVDVLTPNASEGRIMLGLEPDAPADPQDIAAHLVEMGVGAVVLTLGADGALMVDRNGALLIPATQVDVVDTTGAGDAFTGTLAAMLAMGATLEDAAHASAVAGALACTAIGVIPALPDLAALRKRRATSSSRN
jgi:ribokinase